MASMRVAPDPSHTKLTHRAQVVFGKILDGAENMLVLRKIENTPVGANSKPLLTCRIVGGWP
jgi:hypothetical protein